MYVFTEFINTFTVQCRGFVTTDLEKKATLKRREHNHPCDRKKLEVLKAVHRMKSKAKCSMDKPTQIFAEEVQKLSNDVRSCLPLEDAVKRTLRNQRSADYPILPNSLNDLKIEGKNINTFFF